MKTKFHILLLTLIPLLLNGCIDVNEEFSSVRDLVIMNIGNDYKSEFQYSIGSVGITVSSWVIDTAEDTELPSEILDDVSSVQIGVYKKLKGVASYNISTLNEIESSMQKRGWKSILRSSTSNELTGIYVRKNQREILDRLFVINFDHDELVLIEVEGNLKEAISTVIREKGMKIDI